MLSDPVQPLTLLPEFLLRNAVLVLVLGLILRLPLFARLLYGSQPDSPQTRLLFTGYWTIAALLATRLAQGSAYLPFLAGRYGGPGPGLVVGMSVGIWLNLSGASLPSVLVYTTAGVLGGWTHGWLAAGRRSPLWLAAVAGSLSLLGMDRPDAAGRWLLSQVVAAGDTAWGPFLGLGLAFAIADYVFIRMMEYLMAEGERHSAMLSSRMLELADDTAELLAGGWTQASATLLATRLRQRLEVAAVCVGGKGLFSFDGHAPHHGGARPTAAGSCDHTKVLEGCSPRCPYTSMEIVPIGEGALADGEYWVGLINTRRHTLSPAARQAGHALGSALSGILARSTVLRQQAELEEARHRLLQAQIRPHFLFNTLNTIAAAEGDQARELVLKLADFLRESFQRDRAFVSLARELDVVRSYLAIERARFGDRLEVVYDFPEPLPNCELPSFSLQPLVENAVLHGLGSLPDGGTITLRGRPEDAGVRIAICDNGVGMESSDLEQLASMKSAGIGVSNVRRRLEASFGETTRFLVESRPGAGTEISFTLPYSSSRSSPKDASPSRPNLVGGLDETRTPERGMD